MKKNIKWKWPLLAIGSVTVFSSLVTLVSCNDNKKTELDKLKEIYGINTSKNSSFIKYDFGLATEPINNLNYIRYKSMDKVLPSLVDSYLKSGPNAQLKSVIPTNQFNFVMMDVIEADQSSNFDDYYKKLNSKLETEDGYGNVLGQWYAVDNFSIVGGLGAPTIGSDVKKSASMYAFRNPKNQNNYMAITGNLNEYKNKWSNGDYVNASDLRDYLEYILDLNTGSQKLDTIVKYSFRAADEFLAAQREYSKLFNTSYKNPWGRRKYIYNSELGRYIQDPNDIPWKSQVSDSNGNPIDLDAIEKIKQAALKFGFYTGQYFLDFSNEEIAKSLHLNPNFNPNLDVQDFILLTKDAKQVQIKLIKNQYVNPYQKFEFNNNQIESKIKTLSYNQFGFTAIFDENKTPDLSYLLFTILSNLYPINRAYVETQGEGIEKYGSDPKKFLTTGPFLIDDIVLGPQGYIDLVKDKDYFDASNTISNKIKILFSTDKNINATFFEDGIISQTFIPANKITGYWSDPLFKQYLNKNQGYGTIAYGFNLDNETNTNGYVQDQDLRNAIYFAIDREDILKYVGWDFSFPVNTWTAYGQYKSFDGKNLEMFFNGLTSNAKNNKTFDLQNYEYVIHLSKAFNFEKTQRKDIAYDLETARYYLDRFKAKHPDLKGITLTFLNNSTDEQKKAGQFLKEKLNAAFNGYINIELKSLPENTFVSFIETGKYDIIYQNYDRIGGNGPSDYIGAFFKRDEIDSLGQKNIAFKDNPVGSFIYADYISNLVLEKLVNPETNKTLTKIEVLTKDINRIRGIIESNSEWINLIQRPGRTKNKLLLTEFSQTKSKEITQILKEKYADNSNLFTNEYVSNLILYISIILNKDSLKLDNISGLTNLKIAKAFNEYIFNKFGIEKIVELTADTRERLNFNQVKQSVSGKQIPDYWRKFIDLSYQRNDETLSEYTSRLNAFFSGNLTNEENSEGWDQAQIYTFIGSIEKIVRDAAPVIPLMEVDTNWEITKVGGVDSLYRFALQYAYDYTKPPRSGLPRRKDG